MVVALKGKRRLYESRDGLADTASKIRAQRKFAQGVVVLNEELNTVKKEKKKKKKRVDPHALSPSPTSSPSKRPKTEDFLNFLCFRGTPVLPPELEFFNYVPISTRSKDDVAKNSSKSTPSLQPGKAKEGQNQSTSKKEKEPSTNTPSKDSNKTTTPKGSSSSTPAKDSAKSQKTIITPKKRIETSGKDGVGKPSKTTVPPALASPKSPRINEQDAQFAMTALKLKYQEKRLSKLQAVNNVVSKLTKKVKDRVILTRSKAKDTDRVSPKALKSFKSTKSPESKFLHIKGTLKQAQRVSQERNAPSPDIIYGVRPRDVKKSDTSDCESGSTAASTDVGSSDEEEAEKKTPTKTVRSLRRGRAYVFEAKEIVKIKKKLIPHRISTRASRSSATSPLRELPMYGSVKKKKMAKKSSKPKGIPKREVGNRRESHDSESSLRPTRRTKENAAIYLGLLNKDFSSDENESDSDSRGKKDGDESGNNSSSSETKFLEKQYHACLKREKFKSKEGGKAKEKDKQKQKSTAEKSKKKKAKEVKKKVPEKRMLRSQSSKEYGHRNRETEEVEESARVTRRRVTVPLSPSDRPLAGAARKSASQVPRRNVERSSSSSASDSDSEREERRPRATKKVKGKDVHSKHKAKPTAKRVEDPSSAEEGTSSEEEDGERPGLDKKNKKTEKDEPPTPTLSSTNGSSSDSGGESEEENGKPDNESSEVESSESDDGEEEPPVQKVSIAIQVDMDSEENDEVVEIPNPNSREGSVQTITAPPRIPDYAPEIGRTAQIGPPSIERPLLIPYSGPTYFPNLNPTPLGTSPGLITQQNDFSLVFPSLNMTGSLPMHNFAHGQLSAYSTILSAQTPLCFTSAQTSSNFSSAATTLQTHIRSVAANLDIPLVRPIVSSSGGNSLLTLPLPGTRHHNPPPPLTRPPAIPSLNMWLEPTRNVQQQSQAAFSAQYSAFRLPFSAAPPISTASTSRQFTPLATMIPARGLIASASQAQCKNNFTTGRTSAIPKTSANASAGSSRPPQPSQTQGLTLIQSLPNVSIVPRFDRNSKPVSVLPEQTDGQLPGSSSKTSASAVKSKGKQVEKLKTTEPKKVGRKRKTSLIPTPTSPLTVRKDTTTPATYKGLAAKKQQKGKEPMSATKAPPTPPPSQSSSKHVSNAKKCTDSFNKLLQSKTSDSGSYKSSPSSSPCPSTSDSIDKDKVKEEEKREQIPEVPTYFPTDEEFLDPMKYIEGLQEDLEDIGMARIVPPRSFRPECNVEDDMRFTAYNHYVHRMHRRWGPNVHERMAILEQVRKSKVSLAPMIGGMEVDLATLFHTVQSFGGLKEVIEKHKWNKVSDAMHIPKAANDRASKLDGIYVKYVLPYEMLSENERKKLLAEVQEKWRCREDKSTNDEYSDSESDEDDPFEEVEDCIIKGKSTPLSAYYRVARNTLSMIFRNKEPTCLEVETNYWRQVQDKTRHLCVYSGSIDCAGAVWGFPLPKASNKHPWNLKVVANNPGSILRSMGPVMAQLHVGMVFTTYCWYRDPHGLPWLEYQHSGGNKIWYVVPKSHESLFKEVLAELMPAQCKNKKIWLPSDSVMVPLELLIERGVPVYRAVQNAGEFLVVLSGAFTSAICTGYIISESVSFALPKWLNSARHIFQDIRESKEPPVFALEKLLMSIINDNKASADVVKKALGLLGQILKEEFSWRKKLCDMGLSTGKMDSFDSKISKNSKKKDDEEVFECNNCNYILHFSVVVNKNQEFVYCLPHAVKHLLKSKSHVKSSCLLFDYSEAQLNSQLEAVRSRLK